MRDAYETPRIDHLDRGFLYGIESWNNPGIDICNVSLILEGDYRDLSSPVTSVRVERGDGGGAAVRGAGGPDTSCCPTRASSLLVRLCLDISDCPSVEEAAECVHADDTVDDAEGDRLGRVVRHEQDVAGLESGRRCGAVRQAAVSGTGSTQRPCSRIKSIKRSTASSSGRLNFTGCFPT